MIYISACKFLSKWSPPTESIFEALPKCPLKELSIFNLEGCSYCNTAPWDF